MQKFLYTIKCFSSFYLLFISFFSFFFFFPFFLSIINTCNFLFFISNDYTRIRNDSFSILFRFVYFRFLYLLLFRRLSLRYLFRRIPLRHFFRRLPLRHLFRHLFRLRLLLYCLFSFLLFRLFILFIFFILLLFHLFLRFFLLLFRYFLGPFSFNLLLLRQFRLYARIDAGRVSDRIDRTFLDNRLLLFLIVRAFAHFVRFRFR